VPNFAPTSAPKSSMPTTTNIPQSRDVAIPDFTSNTYAAFNVTITGNIATPGSMGLVWAPRETRFVLRGGYVHILCLVALVGAIGELWLYDELSTQPALPITNYGPTTLAGWVNAIIPWHFDLGKGLKSQAKNNRLLIGGTTTIGAGQLQCSGQVWGVQEQ
jgi:hypothetical protein